MLLNFLSKQPSSCVWVLVTSGEEARVFNIQKQRDERPASWTRRNPLVSEDLRIHFIPVPDMVLKAETRGDYEDPSLGHTIKPYPDLQDKIETKFARNIANALDCAADKGAFDHLVLVAPKQMMPLIKQSLSRTTQEKLLTEISKNMMTGGHIEEKVLLSTINANMADVHAVEGHA